MKKYIYLLVCCLLLLGGCSQAPQKQNEISKRCQFFFSGNDAYIYSGYFNIKNIDKKTFKFVYQDKSNIFYFQ